MDEHIKNALDQLKKGGDPERAKVHAMLAIAEALDNLAAEVRGMGTEMQPIHVETN